MSTQPPDQAQWFLKDVQVHEPALRAYLRGAFPSLTDVDDIVQESYARLIRKRQSGSPSHTKAYLFATARNAALDFFRRRKVVEIETVPDLERVSVSSAERGADEALNRKQELELLGAAVEELPMPCREIIRLRLREELQQKEIAVRLGMTEAAVKAQIAKGLLLCSRYFAQRGLLRLSPNTPGTPRE